MFNSGVVHYPSTKFQNSHMLNKDGEFSARGWIFCPVGHVALLLAFLFDVCERSLCDGSIPPAGQSNSEHTWANLSNRDT